VGEGCSKSLLSSITKASQAFKSKLAQSPMPTRGVEEERSYTPIPLPEQKEVISPEEDKLRQSKDLETQRRLEEEERIRKANHAEEERIKEATRRAQELRERPFTYDYEGRIMMLKPANEVKGPFGETEFQIPIQEPPTSTNKRRIAKVFSSKELLPSIKQRKAPAADIEFVKNVQSGQPPLFDNIKLAPGVRIGEGNKYKNSPNKHKSKTLTRAQYRNLTESPGLLMTTSSYSSSMRSSRREVRGEAREEVMKSQVVTSNHELLSEIPDIEDEDAHEVIQKPSPRKSKSSRNFASITKFGEDMEEDEGMSEVDKFNFQIMKSKNWGSNPPVREPIAKGEMPKRPTHKGLQQTHGYKKRLPRDRPFIETKSSRSHLPPPPLGMTMGHGLLHVQSEYLASLLTSRQG